MTPVFVAIYEHRHGVDTAVFTTHELAEAWKDELADAYWDELNEGLEEDDPEYVVKPAEGAGTLYFELKEKSLTPEYFEVRESILRSE